MPYVSDVGLYTDFRLWIWQTICSSNSIQIVLTRSLACIYQLKKKKMPHLSFRKGKGFKCKSVKRTDWKIPCILPMDCRGYAELLQLPFHLQFVAIRMHFKFHSVSTHSYFPVWVSVWTHTHTVGTDEYKCPLVHSFFCFWAAGFVAAAVPIASIWALPCLALNRLGWAGLGWAFFLSITQCMQFTIYQLYVCVCVWPTR